MKQQRNTFPLKEQEKNTKDEVKWNGQKQFTWERAQSNDNKDDVKRKCRMKAKLTQSCLTFCNSMNYTVHGILQVRILQWVAVPFSRGSSQPRDQTQVSCMAGGFFTSWTQGKPKNTGVGSLSFLQQIFLTQELNQRLLHCRQILYQLSYQGSPGNCL